MKGPPELEHPTANAMAILVTITIFQKSQMCQVIIWQNNGVKKLCYKTVWKLGENFFGIFSPKTQTPKIINDYLNKI